jgi:hypothetical protein
MAEVPLEARLTLLTKLPNPRVGSLRQFGMVFVFPNRFRIPQDLKKAPAAELSLQHFNDVFAAMSGTGDPIDSGS